MSVSSPETTPIPAEGAPELGLRPMLRNLLGVAILLLAIRLAEPLFFGAGYYNTLTFHPFWAVVLIAALQHGLTIGVITVVMATLLLDFPDRIVGEDATVYLARASILPLRWLIVALLVGLIRQSQIKAAEALFAENTRLTQANEVLANEVERMDGMVMTLERQAVARPAAATEGLALSGDGAAQDAIGTDLAALRRAAPQLAALTTTSGAELDGTFSDAAKALLDLPVLMVLNEPGAAPMVLGDTQALDDTPEDVAWEMLEVAEDGESVALDHDSYGWITICAKPARAIGQTRLAVVTLAPDAQRARAAEGRVALLAEMARLAIDRLSHAFLDDLENAQQRESASTTD